MSARLARSLASLYARAPRGIQLGLGPMKEACARAGHPQSAFAVVHVTGTNGKGSVCAMVEEILRRAGQRTGLYTSPHLMRFAERIRLEGAPIGDDLLLETLEQVEVDAPELSFFEATTLAALLAFRAAKVDIAVVEVGIGGRLDATNVFTAPVVTAITRVAFDHTEYLGDTLAEIAREKMGIARPSAPMVLGPLEDGPLRVVETLARDEGVRLVRSDDAAARRELTQARLLPKEASLRGSYQEENRRVAAFLARELRAFSVTDETIREGLAHARWAGRLETIDAREVSWILDAAHNPDGARALAASLATTPVDVLLFGTLADKKWKEMLDAVAPLAARRIYASPSSGLSARPAADLSALARRHAGQEADGISAAIDLAAAAAAASPGRTVLVCGSIFLLGEVRATLLDLPRDPPLAL